MSCSSSSLPSLQSSSRWWLQVEQLENQLRAKGGVAPKPGSGGAGESKIVVEGDEMKISLHGSATQKNLQVLLALWLVLVMRVLNIRVMVALVRASLLAMTCWTMLYGSSFGMMVWVIGGRLMHFSVDIFLEMPTTYSFFACSKLTSDHRIS